MAFKLKLMDIAAIERGASETKGGALTPVE